MCTDELMDSHYELKLKCGPEESGGNTVKGISVINEEILIIGLTSNDNENSLCSYNMSEINHIMDSVYLTCVVLRTGHRNVQWTSSSCSVGII